MGLEERLRLLRGEAAPASAPLPQAPAGDLAERLRRLAPLAQRTAPARRPDEQALADAIGAERIAPGVLRVERRLPLAQHHGRGRLGDCQQALPGLLDTATSDPAGWLFLDTETSGLAGGTGTWAFLCGLARFDPEGFVLRQYLLTRLDAEPVYLEAVRAELASAALLVTYNGKAFDSPLLTTRFRLAGMAAVLAAKAHLDLLALVRRAFGPVWPDCRLVTAETRLLSLTRKGDLPGSEAPQAWLAWLRQGEMAPLAGVLTHNRADLLSLPALVSALERSYRDPAATGADIRAVSHHHLRRGDSARALHLLCANRDALSAAGLLDLARLYRAGGHWGLALEIWGPLAERGEAEAIAALAKYLEHRARDYVGALDMARRLAPGPGRDQRCRRLADKLSSSSAPIQASS